MMMRTLSELSHKINVVGNFFSKIDITGSILRKVLVKQDLERVYYNRSVHKVDEQRPCWPEVWMNVAKEISRRSCDEKLKVCAIIVPEDNTGILSVGYNGDIKGGTNRRESLEPGKSAFVHAEANALLKFDYNFHKKKHMYVTHSPCIECARLIINADISRVVYNEPFRDLSGLDLLKRVGIEVYTIDEAILITGT
jgi:dCMP deaminase